MPNLGGAGPLASGGFGQTKDTLDLGLGRRKPALGDITVGIKAGGLRGKFGVDDLVVTTSPERQALVDRLAGSFVSRADDLAGIRDLVRPGFSEFRRRGLEQLDIRKRSAVGNLRDNLARRRVSGSSFAEDTLSRAEAEFAQEAANFSATSTLQEIDSFLQLTNAIGELRTQEFQTQLSELNLQTQVALTLQGTGAQALSAASLAQQEAAKATVGHIADFAKFGAGSCWVARAVYGPENPEWKAFRVRMFANAPGWFINSYMRFGPAIAVVVERLPVLKRFLRPIMDRAWR